jgi:hypothetical protein
MPQPSVWGVGLWDEARWSYVTVEGAITEGSDITDGGIATINNVGGLVTEGADVVSGAITSNQGVTGAITESPDVVSGEVNPIVFVSGDVAEGADLAGGEIAVLVPVIGNITEGEDIAEGYATSTLFNYVTGAIVESEDVVEAEINNIVYLSCAIKEGKDIVRGNILGPKGVTRGGGWAPQFHYKREWEKEPEVYVEIEEEIYEPDPEALFIPTALPIDPAVARMIDTMMRGPEQIDTDDDDIEALLMQL